MLNAQPVCLSGLNKGMVSAFIRSRSEAAPPSALSPVGAASGRDSTRASKRSLLNCQMDDGDSVCKAAVGYLRKTDLL
jgi:hypothetical protein